MIKSDYKGRIKEVDVPDDVIKSLYEKGKHFLELKSSLEGTVKQLMRIR